MLVLAGVRQVLRARNLYDTTTQHPTAPPPPADYRTARTADGTYNDLSSPMMGAAGTRFGRNAPIELTQPGNEHDVLTPSPRTVSLELLTRETFTPATTLNLLAAAWIQFMIAGWFSHGKSPKEWRAAYAGAFDWGSDVGREVVEE